MKGIPLSPIPHKLPLSLVHPALILQEAPINLAIGVQLSHVLREARDDAVDDVLGQLPAWVVTGQNDNVCLQRQSPCW